MSMSNEIDWTDADNEKICSVNALIVSMYAKRFASGHWSFRVPGSEMTWHNTLKVKPGGKRDKSAQLMIDNFKLSGRPMFQAASPLGRGRLKSKGGGRISIHICADDDTMETLLRTTVSVNQLSICGAVAEWCA